MIAAVIRTATIDEADAVADVYLAARHTLDAFAPMAHDDAATRGWVRDVLFRSAEIWIGVKDGRVAAMMALTAGWIEQLYVEPAAQGQGLGAALLATAKRAAHGAAGLDLWTFQANAQARRFYERHGFVAVAFTDGDNEERVPDMRYAWRP